MGFWATVVVTSIVYSLVRGKKKSSVRYTPNGNAYVTDGSGYTYPVVSKEKEVEKPKSTGFLDVMKFILISFTVGTLAYVFFGDIKNGFWNSNYGLFLVLGVIVVSLYCALALDRQAYLAKPTVQQYAKEHPSSKTQSGYSCNQCGSRSIRNWGVDGATDMNRVFICNHCGTHLYRN